MKPITPQTCYYGKHCYYIVGSTTIQKPYDGSYPVTDVILFLKRNPADNSEPMKVHRSHVQFPVPEFVFDAHEVRETAWHNV